MRSKTFIIEALWMLLITLSLRLMMTQDEIITIVLESLLSICFIALSGIIVTKRIRIILNIVVSLLGVLVAPSYILLLPLVYLLTFDIGFYSLLVLLLAFIINPGSYYMLLIGVLGVYIADQSQQIIQQQATLNEVRDTLTEEQLRMKNQMKDLIQSNQKDIDISILSERNRISNELHDAIGHSLARSIIQIEAIMIANDNDKIEKQLNQLQINLRHGMDDIRHTIHHIHHESLDFEVSIDNMREEFAPLMINFDLHTETEFKYNQKKDILSIIREAIINSIKHSNSTQMNIILQEFPEHNKLLIKDNGTDYDENQDHSEGMGKTIIRQIANKYNAPILFYYQNGYIVQMNLPK